MKNKKPDNERKLKTPFFEIVFYNIVTKGAFIRNKWSNQIQKQASAIGNFPNSYKILEDFSQKHENVK